MLIMDRNGEQRNYSDHGIQFYNFTVNLTQLTNRNNADARLTFFPVFRHLLKTAEFSWFLVCSSSSISMGCLAEKRKEP
jgi:hypothetical protein